MIRYTNLRNKICAGKQKNVKIHLLNRRTAVTGDAIQLEMLKTLINITHEMKLLKESSKNGTKRQRVSSRKLHWTKRKNKGTLQPKNTVGPMGMESELQ